MPRSVWQIDRAFALEELHSQALANMPGNVAVHKPMFLTLARDG